MLFMKQNLSFVSNIKIIYKRYFLFILNYKKKYHFIHNCKNCHKHIKLSQTYQKLINYWHYLYITKTATAKLKQTIFNETMKKRFPKTFFILNFLTITTITVFAAIWSTTIVKLINNDWKHSLKYTHYPYNKQYSHYIK